jgi:putative transferase (TIGR04331 family)
MIGHQERSMEQLTSKRKTAASEPEFAGPSIGLFDRLLDATYPLLNKLHGLDRSRRFWAILLYRHLSRLAWANPSIGMAPPDEIPRTEHARRGRGSATNRLRDTWYLPGEAIRRTEVAYLLRSPLVSARSIVTGFHYYHVISRLVARPASFLELRARAQRTTDAAARRALQEMVEDVDFPLARRALKSLPSGYVEEFRSLYDGVYVKNAEEKEFHASMLPAVEARMTIARHVEEGSRLSFYQHAANYGEIRNHVRHYAESGIADRFRTWGWKLRENDEPYLALRLMKPPRLTFQPKPEASSWLFIIVRQPLPSLIEATRTIQRRFFGTLRDERAAKIVVRPCVKKGGSVASQIVEEIRPRVRCIDDGTARMVDQFRDTELVILDRFPSTIFMECVTADVPVIGIVPNDVEFTQNASRFYDEFFRLGLLHKDPESAAAFLNSLTVGSWWQEVTRLDSFRDYLHTFCNRDISRHMIDAKPKRRIAS